MIMIMSMVAKATAAAMDKPRDTLTKCCTPDVRERFSSRWSATGK